MIVENSEENYFKYLDMSSYFNLLPSKLVGATGSELVILYLVISIKIIGRGLVLL